tara:strand:+ start:474 stop:614 length:141 start_codon:yes stop_codon:yes gene_type:complete
MIEDGIALGRNGCRLKKKNVVLVTALAGPSSHLTGGCYGGSLAPSK